LTSQAGRLEDLLQRLSGNGKGRGSNRSAMYKAGNTVQALPSDDGLEVM